LVEQQGVAYANTIAGAMNLKTRHGQSQQTARNCAEQFSILSPGEKCQSKKGMVEILPFSPRSFSSNRIRGNYSVMKIPKNSAGSSLDGKRVTKNSTEVVSDDFPVFHWRHDAKIS
jgi:hypothetical protein